MRIHTKIAKVKIRMAIVFFYFTVLSGCATQSATTSQTPPPPVEVGLDALMSYPPETARARMLLLESLKGQQLTDENRWKAFEGVAASHVLEGDYASAIPWLLKALPISKAQRRTNYNLACAYCRTKQADKCFDHLSRALKIHSRNKSGPSELSGHIQRSDLVERARSDTDLELIRGEYRFQRLLMERRHPFDGPEWDDGWGECSVETPEIE